ncbi:MAG: 2-C-methyl-D-erythritol 4-phosphate cytidylyltransferase [Bifidobacteriaceae bacterium]|nr:2-C-methyl-D-erythritol 4-phosphate cytidylyltransferase [Bifidobacteriaceae bacterium]
MSDSQQVPVVAIILAAGFGMRFDPSDPKQLVSIAGKPVIEWSIEAFVDSPRITDVLLVVNPKVYAAVERIVDDMGADKVRGLIPGGETRADSTRAALGFLAQMGIPGDAKILIHDGVRPFVTPRIIQDCDDALNASNAATVAVPSTDTILIAAPQDGAGAGSAPVVHAVPERSTTWRAQTPQCFRFDTIRSAYERAASDENFHPTDDTRVVVDYLPGEKVTVVQGSDDNIKITTRADVDVAELIAPRARRVRTVARMRAARGGE